MKLVQLIIFLSFCLGTYSAHAGITGTPTPKSAQTAASDDDKHNDTDEESKSNDHHYH